MNIKNKKNGLAMLLILIGGVMVSGCTSIGNDSNSKYPGIVVTDFDVENFDFNPTTNEPGGNWTTVSASIENQGDVEYRNVVVTFDLYDANGEIIKSVNETLPLLKPGDNENPMITFEEPQGIAESRCRILSAEKV